VTTRVLVADDDDDIRLVARAVLEGAGLAVIEAHDGQEALEMAVAERPDVVVLDRHMPRMDGLEALRRIREDGRIAHVPVILCTSASATDDVLAGFDAGADDYVSKPYNPQEFVARVRAAGRRLVDLRALQPLTGLPGNTVIDREVARRVAHGTPFALLLADLNNFKAYNDRYGFARGDEVLLSFAQLLVQAADEHGGAATFVGHVGGDDFVAVTDIDSWRVLADQVCEWFDALAPTLYDDHDRAAGCIIVPNRAGQETRYPLVAVSIGVAIYEPGEDIHPEELVSAATEMKSFAKSQVADGGSNACVDRRLPGVDDDGEPAPPPVPGTTGEAGPPPVPGAATWG
jgi:PleD family two-component response regulator